MSPIAAKFVEILPQTAEQRDAAGKVRWLYMVNLIVSVLASQDKEFNASEFYAAVGVFGTPQSDMVAEVTTERIVSVPEGWIARKE